MIEALPEVAMSGIDTANVLAASAPADLPAAVPGFVSDIMTTVSEQAGGSAESLGAAVSEIAGGADPASATEAADAANGAGAAGAGEAADAADAAETATQAQN